MVLDYREPSTSGEAATGGVLAFAMVDLGKASRESPRCRVDDFS